MRAHARAQEHHGSIVKTDDETVNAILCNCVKTVNEVEWSEEHKRSLIDTTAALIKCNVLATRSDPPLQLDWSQVATSVEFNEAEHESIDSKPKPGEVGNNYSNRMISQYSSAL